MLTHPGYTRTNLQTAGARLGHEGTRQPWFTRIGVVPSQAVEGTQPRLFAAAGPKAEQGGYYGPGGRLGVVAATAPVTLPRSSRGVSLPAALWSVAEALTDTKLPDLVIAN